MSNSVIQHPVVLKRSMNHITEAAYLLAQSVCEYTHVMPSSMPAYSLKIL